MPLRRALALENSADPRSVRAPTEVCITIDTEFSIGGAFADPKRYRPLSNELVECAIDGRAEGLGFILDTLREHGVSATFFVEALQCFYFGDRPMGRIAQRIVEAGHDVQLHLHPGWYGFRRRDWRTRPPESDQCTARSLDELQEMIGFGAAMFSRWGLPAPKALRTGSFYCNRTVHQAMLRSGLTLGSNICHAVCRSADPEFHVLSGTRVIDGVLEIPALTYATPHPAGPRWRALAITATSWAETQTLLLQARQADISPIAVLTHPFEFVKRADFRFRELRRNQVNRQRFEQLVEFLGRQNGAFSPTTFTRSGDAWLAAGSRPGAALRVPTHLAMARLGENMLNTQLWQY